MRGANENKVLLRFIRQNTHAITLVTPLVTFFVLGALIPSHTTNPESGEVSFEPTGYLLLVMVQVIVIGGVIAGFWRAYLADFPLQVDRWGWMVGMVGGVLWVFVCSLGLERMLVESIGVSTTALGGRSSVNPGEAYPDVGIRAVFLAFRFAMLVIIVPIAEELFLRGFLMRFVDSDDWANQPLEQIGRIGLLCGTAYGMLAHPGEFVAAGLWFSMISLLMLRTGRFWNCVIAHGVTNAMLGAYVLVTGNWQLW